MKYNLSIVDAGKTLLMLALMVAWGPIVGKGVLDKSFWKEHILVVVLILWIAPLCLFFLWFGLQKYKDIFTLTEVGIETKIHGIIKWDEIKMCSWESIYGSICILFILKNGKLLYITPCQKAKDAEGSALLIQLFEEIKNKQKSLPQDQTFRIVEERVSKFLYRLLLLAFTFWLLVKSIKYFMKH